MLPWGCAPWRAASAVLAVCDRDQGWVRVHSAVLWPLACPVGQHPLPLEAALLVSYTASFNFCEIVESATRGVSPQGLRPLVLAP